MLHNSPSDPPRLGKADFFAILSLCALIIAFFWRMVFTDLILPRGDVFTYFYPYWQYRNEALRSGAIPLWNPYLFMGAPFLANSQAGVLYPPNWLLVPFDAPTAVKIAIVTHEVWAAAGMYLFARRSIRLSVLAAAISGVVFALGGYFTAQVEHVNQLQGLAWLTWLFWLWEETQPSYRRLIVLALAMAAQLLAGHTQSAFISGVGLGLWALWHTIAAWRRQHAAASAASRDRNFLHSIRYIPMMPLGLLAAAVLVAVGLAAAQLLPTFELTRLSYRSGGLPSLDAVSFSLRPELLGRAFLPGFGETSLFSEYVAYPGIAALMLAVMGAWTSRQNPKHLGLAALSGIGVFLALGAYNPIYWVLVQAVPGFDLFRAPARWLVLWSLGSSVLAGVGLDTLADICLSGLNRRARSRLVLLPFAAASLLILLLATLSPLAALSADEVIGASSPHASEVAVWAITLLLTMGLLALACRSTRHLLGWAPTALAALIAVELFFAGRSLPYNHLSAPAAWSTQRPAISTLLAEQQGRATPDRFLSLSDIRFDPGDLREIEAIFGPYLTDTALYEYIIATKQKEILAPNLPMAWGIPAMDGFDGGILPTRDYIRFTGLFLDESELAPDGRLRENLHAVPHPHWLSLANVRYVVTDKVYDAWVEGTYYDLQFEERRRAEAGSAVPITMIPSQPFEATAVGLIGHVEGAASAANGVQIGSVAIYPGEMQEASQHLTQPLLLGTHFAEGSPGEIAHTRPEPIGAFTVTDPDLVEYHALISWQSPETIEQIKITAVSTFPGTLVLRGATLIDERSGAFLPLSLSAERQVIHSGDVKIYELSASLPRAYLTCNPSVVTDQEAMWEELRAEEGQNIIVESSPPAAGNCNPSDPGTAVIIHYAAESVVVDVNAHGTGVYLIMSDAWYPGWSASIDGAPVTIRRANGLFRGIPVPPGAHQLRFSFRSRPFEIGAAISLLTLAGVLLALLFWRRPSRDR